MTVITGRQAKLQIRIDGVWYDLLCATQCAFGYQFEQLLTTHRNSGRFRERESRLCDWYFSVSGLTKYDDSDGQVSTFYLMQQSVRGTVQMMRARYTDADGNIRYVSGEVLIEGGLIDSAVNGFSMVSHTFPGSGAFSTSDVAGLAPTELIHRYFVTTPGAYEVEHADMEDVVAVHLVSREDGFYIETSGTPAGRKFKFTDLGATGKLTFDSTLPFNPGEIVYALLEVNI